MKKCLVLVYFAISLFFLSSCNSWEEHKAEKIITTYYTSLIKKEYKKAFAQLTLYDDAKKIFGETTLSNKEAKKIFLEKMDYVEKQKYELTNFKIIEVEYEDGHSFWHHVEVKGKVNGESFIFNEVASIYNGKVTVRSKDPYLYYRDGNMNVEEVASLTK